MSTALMFHAVASALLYTGLAAPAAAPAAAEPLVVRVGETWLFAIQNGAPVRARRVAVSARPARGEIKASVSAMAGTTMTLTNNSRLSYTFSAELVGAAQSRANKRTCTLPPMRPTIEYWPVKSAGVRIGNFQATDEAAACPS